MANKPKFGDIAGRLKRKEIKQRLYAVLTRLAIMFKKNDTLAVKQCYQIRDCLENPSDSDPGRLPVWNPIGYCPFQEKTNCLIFTLCTLVFNYWQWLKDNQDIQLVELENRLAMCEDIAKNGLGNYVVKGTRYPGYYLVKK